MEDLTEEECFQIARELIEQHGDGVAAYLEEQIQATMDVEKLYEFRRWFLIRNAVALTLRGNVTRH